MKDWYSKKRSYGTSDQKLAGHNVGDKRPGRVLSLEGPLRKDFIIRLHAVLYAFAT